MCKTLKDNWRVILNNIFIQTNLIKLGWNRAKGLSSLDHLRGKHRDSKCVLIERRVNELTLNKSIREITSHWKIKKDDIAFKER